MVQEGYRIGGTFTRVIEDEASMFVMHGLRQFGVTLGILLVVKYDHGLPV